VSESTWEKGIRPIYGAVVSGHPLLESPPQLWRVAGGGHPPSILILCIKIPAHKLGFVKALFQEFCENSPAGRTR
jgi:hypothetical protein